VVVAGGKGGSGATFLALDIGWAAADPGQSEPLRVLLVDANHLNSDLDLRLGVADPDRDQFPSARVDQLLLRLPDLAERRVRLQSMLWNHSTRPLSALLGPAHEAANSAVGPEHLDYLFRYLLAPSFDLIVVDAGLLCGQVGTQARFWLGQAHRLLLPMRPALTDRRMVARSLRVVEESYDVGRERCRAVVGLERGQGSRQLALGPELDGIGIHTRPWVPQIAMMAEVRHVPMAELDRRVAASTRDLLPDIFAAEPLEHSRA
jgi:cellulose biosynthesis protein BcsQ